jgi:hypothetical protein
VKELKITDVRRSILAYSDKILSLRRFFNLHHGFSRRIEVRGEEAKLGVPSEAI